MLFIKLWCRLLPSEMRQENLTAFKFQGFGLLESSSQEPAAASNSPWARLMACDLWGHANSLMALIAWLVTMSQFSHAETIGHRPWQTEFWFGSNPKMRLGFYWGRWTCHPLWPVDTSWIDKFPVQSIYPAQTRFWKSYNENLTSGMLRTIAKDKIINKKWWRQRLTANVT